MQFVDIGINLTNKRFDKDREQVIASALAVGVSKMVITGTNLKESQAALTLAQAYPKVLYSTAGCHPHDAKSLTPNDLAIIESIATHSEVVAIGECGLDFNRNFSPKETQLKVFEQQLELAVKLQKPVFLHERDAFDSQYQILKDYMPQLKAAVVHCFTGEKAAMDAYLDLGLAIGITGWICDERRGQSLYANVKHIPDDRLMVETDGPYLTPRNLTANTQPPKPKDGRNEPKFLPQIATALAQARAQSLEHIARISYANSCRFFNID